MDMHPDTDIESLLAALPADPVAPLLPDAATPARSLRQMMRKIPVTLTLEVGMARISLHDLSEIGADSLVELDTLAGEPLVMKVNGTTIGRAEVVVSGENYGLKVVEMLDLDFDALAS